jgi:hypothetical protein
MSAQIIPFQTKRDRVLALAISWYRNIRDEYAKEGSIVDREKVIEEAVVEAMVEEWLGRRYWDKPDMATDGEDANRWREIARFRSRERNTLHRRLDDCLQGKWQRMKSVAPRRPRRWKPRSDAPIAQIIPFRIHCS